MRLLLLRHAKAEKAEMGMRDRERRLTARGCADAGEIAGYMKQHGFLPDRVLVSAAQRTRETWEQMAAAFSPAPSVAFEDRLYEAGPDTITALIKAEAGAPRTLLLVGHNPGLHEAARLLLAASDAASRELADLPTAGLVVIDFAGHDWRMLAAGSGHLACFATPGRITAASD
jgi:phosphohistidine phosphatase